MATGGIKRPNSLKSEVLQINSTSDQYGQVYVSPNLTYGSGKVFAVFCDSTNYVSNVTVAQDGYHLYIQFRKRSDNSAVANTNISATVLLLGYL